MTKDAPYDKTLTSRCPYGKTLTSGPGRDRGGGVREEIVIGLAFDPGTEWLPAQHCLGLAAGIGRTDQACRPPSGRFPDPRGGSWSNRRFTSHLVSQSGPRRQGPTLEVGPDAVAAERVIAIEPLSKRDLPRSIPL